MGQNRLTLAIPIIASVVLLAAGASMEQARPSNIELAAQADRDFRG